jgi:hypothetical protein
VTIRRFSAAVTAAMLALIALAAMPIASLASAAEPGYDATIRRTAFGSETRELLRLLPARPAPDATSIFKTQKSGGARSAFAA